MGGYTSTLNWNPPNEPTQPPATVQGYNPTNVPLSSPVNPPQGGLLPANATSSMPGSGGTGYMSLFGIGTSQEYLSAAQADYAGALDRLTAPELQSYINYLNQSTSADPTQRMAAAGPVASAEQTTQNAARNAIKSSTPRGGEQDYLVAQSYQQEASDIGNFINQAYTQAQTAKGQVGEAGISQTLAAQEGAISGYGAAASTINSGVQTKIQQQHYNDQMIEQLLMNAAGGYGATDLPGANIAQGVADASSQ